MFCIDSFALHVLGSSFSYQLVSIRFPLNAVIISSVSQSGFVTGEKMMELAHLEQSLLTNPAPRCPCMVLLDTSGSMQGRPIAELGDGVGQFIAELQGD